MIHCLAASICPAEKCLISADTKCDVRMLCDVSQVGVRYDSDSLYALVMISNKAKLVDHCPKTLPSRERRGFDDETGKTAGCLDVRVDRLREFHKVVAFSIADFGCTCRMECSVSRLYSIMCRSGTVTLVSVGDLGGFVG